MSDSHPVHNMNRQGIYTHLEEYNIKVHLHDPIHKEARSRKHSKQAPKKSSSKGKPRTIPQFRVKKYNNKLLDKLVSLLGYTIQSADKAMQYIPLSTYFDANFQTRLYYSDRQNLMNWLNALEENDARAVGTFVEGKESEKYENVDELYYRSGEDTGRKSARSKSQANPDYELGLEVNQQYNSLPQPHNRPQNDIQCQSCRSLSKKHQQLSSAKIENQENKFSSTHHYIDESTAQQIRSDIDRLKSDIEELRKMKRKAQNGETVFFEERISIVEEVYQKCQDRMMNSEDNSAREDERNPRLSKSPVHTNQRLAPQKQRKSHRIEIPQQEFNLLKQIQKQYNQIQSLIRQKSANHQSRNKSPTRTQSKQQRTDRSFHYNLLMRKASLFEEVDQLVSQLESEARCLRKDCEKLHEKRTDKSCQRQTYRQMQFEVEECKRKCDELKRHNDELKKTNQQLKRTSDDLKRRLQRTPSPNSHNQSYSYRTNRVTIIEPQPHSHQSLATTNNKISRLETQLSVCKNNFKAFFTIVKNTLIRYPTINGKKLNQKLIDQLKQVQLKDGKVEKGMEILVKLLDTIVAENTELKIDAETREDASNKSFTYIQTRIQKNINSHILDELERSRHSIEKFRHYKNPQTTKTIATTNPNHKQQIDALQSELYTKDQTILKLSQLLQAKELELSKLKIHVEKHQEHKHQTTKMLTNQHLTLEELRYLLEERDFELGKVKQQLERKDDDMKELQKYLNKVETHAVTLREENSKLKDNLDEYSRQLASLQQEKNAIMDYVAKLERKEKKYEQLVNDKDNQILELKNILREYENGYQELEQRYYEEIENRLDNLGKNDTRKGHSHEKSPQKSKPRTDREINQINSNKQKQHHPILISDISPYKLTQPPTSNKRPIAQSLDHQQGGAQSSQLSQDIYIVLQERDQIIEKLREQNEKLNEKLQNNLELMLTFRNQCNDLQTQINILNDISSTGKHHQSNQKHNTDTNHSHIPRNQQPTHPSVTVSSLKTVHQVSSKTSDSLQPEIIEEHSQRNVESSKKTVHNEIIHIKDPLSHFEQTERPQINHQDHQDKQEKEHQLSRVPQKRSFETKNNDKNLVFHQDSPKNSKICHQCKLKLAQIDNLLKQNSKLKSQASKLHQKAYEQAVRIDELQEDKAQLQKSLNKVKPNRPPIGSKLQKYSPEQEQDTYDNLGHNHTHQDSSEGNTDAFYKYHNMINEQRRKVQQCDHKIGGEDDDRMPVEKRNNANRQQAVIHQLNDCQVSSTAIIENSNHEPSIATVKSQKDDPRSTVRQQKQTPLILVQTINTQAPNSISLSDQSPKLTPQQSSRTSISLDKIEPSINSFDPIRNSLISIDIGWISKKKPQLPPRNPLKKQDQKQVAKPTAQVRISETNISENELVNKIEQLEQRINYLEKMLQNCACQHQEQQIQASIDNGNVDANISQGQSIKKAFIPLIKIEQNESEPSSSNQKKSQQHSSSPSSIHSNPTYSQHPRNQVHYDQQYPIHPYQTLSNDEPSDKQPVHDSSYTNLHPNNVSFDYSPNQKPSNGKRKSSEHSRHNISEDGIGNNTSHKQKPSTLLNEIELEGFKENQELFDMSNNVSSRDRNTERSRQPMTDRSIATVSLKQNLTDRSSNQDISRQLNDSKELDNSKKLDNSRELDNSRQLSPSKPQLIQLDLSKSRQSVNSAIKATKYQQNELLKRNRGDRRPSYLVYKQGNSIFSDLGLDTQLTYRRRVSTEKAPQSQIVNRTQQKVDQRGSKTDRTSKTDPSQEKNPNANCQSDKNEKPGHPHSNFHIQQPSIQQQQGSLQNQVLQSQKETPRKSLHRQNSDSSRVQVDLSNDYRNDPQLEPQKNIKHKNKYPQQHPSRSSRPQEENNQPKNGNTVGFDMNTIRENSQNSQTTSKLSTQKEKEHSSLTPSEVNNEQSANRQKVDPLSRQQQNSLEVVQHFLYPNSQNRSVDPRQVKEKEREFFELALDSRQSSEQIIKQLMHIVKSLRGEMQLLTSQFQTLNHQYIQLSNVHNRLNNDHLDNVNVVKAKKLLPVGHPDEKNTNKAQQRSQMTENASCLLEEYEKKQNSIPETVIQRLRSQRLVEFASKPNIKDPAAVEEELQIDQYIPKQIVTEGEINERQEGENGDLLEKYDNIHQSKQAYNMFDPESYATYLLRRNNLSEGNQKHQPNHTQIEQDQNIIAQDNQQNGFTGSQNNQVQVSKQLKRMPIPYFDLEHKQKIEKIIKKNEQKRHEVSNLSSLLGQKDQQITAMKHEIDTVRQQLESRIDSLMTKIEQLQGTSLKEQFSAQQGTAQPTQIKQKDDKINELQAKLRDQDRLAKQKATQLQSIDKKLIEIKTLLDEQSLLLAQKDHKLNESHRFVEDSKEQSHTIQKLRDQLRDKTQQLEKKANQLSQVKQSVQSKTQQALDLRLQLSNKSQEAKQFYIKFDDLQTKINDLQHHKSFLETEVKLKSKQLSELRSQLNSFAFELPSLQEEVKLLQEKVHFLEKEKHQLAKKLKSITLDQPADFYQPKNNTNDPFTKPHIQSGNSLLFLAYRYTQSQQSKNVGTIIKQSERDNDNEWEREQIKKIQQTLNQRHSELKNKPQIKSSQHKEVNSSAFELSSLKKQVKSLQEKLDELEKQKWQLSLKLELTTEVKSNPKPNDQSTMNNIQSGKSVLFLANRCNELPQVKKEGTGIKQSERDNDNEWEREQIKQIKLKINQRYIEYRNHTMKSSLPHNTNPMSNQESTQQFYKGQIKPVQQEYIKSVQYKSKELKDLESRLWELQGQNDRLRRANDQLRKRADEKQDQYIKQSGQQNHLPSQYHTQYEQITTASNNSAQLSIQLNNLQSKLMQLQNQLQFIKEQKKSLEQSLDEQIQEAQRLQSGVNEVEHVGKENVRLSNELSRLNRELDTLRQEMDRIRGGKERLNSEKSKLSHEVEQLTEQNENLQQKIKQNEEQLKQQKSQFLTLVDKVQSYNTQASTHQKQLNSKNTQIQTIKKQCFQLKGQLSQQSNHSTQLKLANEQLGRQNQQLKQQNTKLKEQVSDLQRELVSCQEDLTQKQLKLAQVKGLKEHSSVEDSKVIEQLKTKVISLMNIINQKQSLIKQTQLQHIKSFNNLNLNLQAKDQTIAQLNHEALTLKSSIKAIQDSISDNSPSGQRERSSSNDKRLVRSEKVLRSSSGNSGSNTNGRLNYADHTYPLENMILKHKEEILSLHKLLRQKDTQIKTLLQSIDLPQPSSTLPTAKYQYKSQPNRQTQQTTPIASQQQRSQQNLSTSQLSDISSANITSHSSDLNQLKNELQQVRNLLTNRQNINNQLLKDKDDQIQNYLKIIQTKNNQIDTNLSLLTQKNQEINKKLTLITQKDIELKKLTQDLDKKTTEITALQSRCASLQKPSTSPQAKQTQRKLDTLEKTNQNLRDQLSIINNQLQSLKDKIEKKSTEIASEKKTIIQLRQQNLQNNKTIEKFKNELTQTKKTLAKHQYCNLASNSNNQNVSPLPNCSQSPTHSQHQPQQRQFFTYRPNQQTENNTQHNSGYVQDTSGQKSPSKRSHSQHNKSEQQTNIVSENNVLNLMSRAKDVSQMNAINLAGKNELFEIHNFVKVYVKNPQNSSFIVASHLPEQQYEFKLSHHELIHGQETKEKHQESRKDVRNVHQRAGSQKVTQMKQNSLEMSSMTDEKSLKSDRSLKQENPRDVQTSRVAFSQQGKATSPPKKRQQSPHEGPRSQIQPISYPATQTPPIVKQAQQKTEKVKSLNSSNSKSGQLNRFYLENIVPQFFGRKKNAQSHEKDAK